MVVKCFECRKTLTKFYFQLNKKYCLACAEALMQNLTDYKIDINYDGKGGAKHG